MTILQSTDIGVPALNETNIAVRTNEFYNAESVGQKLNIELDFGVKTNSTESKNNDDVTSIPQHILVAPVHYEAGYSYPLFVWLHNFGNDERQLVRLMPQISLRNYVAVAPRGQFVTTPSNTNSQNNTTEDWDDYSINAFLKRTNRTKNSYDWLFDKDGAEESERSVFDSIAVAQKSCNIASNRIFIGGVGNGGTMAMRLALMYPKYFAGVAAFDAVMPEKYNVLGNWNLARKLAIFIGTNQSGNISQNSLSKKLQLLYSAGFKLTVREYQTEMGKTVKDLPKQILQEVNRWMMGIVCDEREQKNNNAESTPKITDEL
ncbi:MAG: hypothetical protein LBP59_08170 [Planctomycetaceae bacterium]|jgi:phospholipase/carboxylesterase|nr:hypothetical protein [Planctomycetaceae bacterium]